MATKPVWTLNQIVNQLTDGSTSSHGAIWATSALTFSFPTVLSPDHGVDSTFSTFNDDQRAAARTALQQFAEVINVTFTEVTGPDGNGGDIRFHNQGSLPSGNAHASGPGPGAGGDVFVSPTNFMHHDLLNPVRGHGHGFLTYMHEIGHAMGLGHAGNYNGGNPSYASDALFEQDTEQATVMSYFWGADSGGDHFYIDNDPEFAETLMLYDIAALQSLYGANPTTRNGNSTYGFHSNVGGIYNFVTNVDPELCIYDAGGTDTLDFSGFTVATLLNLNPGTFSNTALMTRNVSIAFGTIIENGSGGSAADTILGNAVANVLRGGGGNDAISAGAGADTLFGGGGNDSLNGGPGADTLNGEAGNDVYNLGADTTDTIIDAAGLDSLTSTVSRNLATTPAIEYLYLQGTANITGLGNALANLLVGNTGNNVLKGGGQNDTLRGGLGQDSQYGDAGNDRFQFLTVADSATGAARDIIYDLDKNGNDVIDISAVVPGAGTYIASNPFSAPGQVRVQQVGANVLVQINTVGNGIAESEILLAGATLGAGIGQVDIGDFLL
jgi:Ca2+-binding RTX toxin-like protein